MMTDGARSRFTEDGLFFFRYGNFGPFFRGTCRERVEFLFPRGQNDLIKLFEVGFQGEG